MLVLLAEERLRVGAHDRGVPRHVDEFAAPQRRDEGIGQVARGGAWLHDAVILGEQLHGEVSREREREREPRAAATRCRTASSIAIGPEERAIWKKGTDGWVNTAVSTSMCVDAARTCAERAPPVAESMTRVSAGWFIRTSAATPVEVAPRPEYPSEAGSAVGAAARRTAEAETARLPYTTDVESRL